VDGIRTAKKSLFCAISGHYSKSDLTDSGVFEVGINTGNPILGKLVRDAAAHLPYDPTL